MKGTNLMTYKSLLSKPESSSGKTLNELNLMDAYLFETVTNNPVFAEKMAKMIIWRALGIQVQDVTVETEKELKGIHMDKRGIRMDIYAKEYSYSDDKNFPDRIYDIEPNNYGKGELPRRSRFYQSLLDTKLLPTGTPFQKLPEIFTIWILPYDPFDDDRMIYTVKNMVVENQKIIYNDGITKIFLFINGNKGGSIELKNMLLYFANTNTANAVDNELSDLQQMVSAIKQDDRERERYMHFVTYEEMIADAEVRGEIIGFITCCRSLNLSHDEILERIMQQFSFTPQQAEDYLQEYQQ